MVELKLPLLSSALPNSNKVSSAPGAPATSVPMLALSVCIALLAAVTFELIESIDVACVAALALA